ncbi:TetR family transcriptional regulator [Asanoa ferruginea]|uniref:TetR family transcriptional regulator n=1 Tax=Asanoa ferruginea TaxID=53367 RepID=A0A3D9ZNL1_9ACTN|nr:TetR/AcrR family transcriptional regulator [Asanoa ferruginea]REF98831.1 TetR family transcriptional regulator [Asanoa ferruginea]GIF49573.1 TetR family transcriptional regulator [Asanoa ferruginea]
MTRTRLTAAERSVQLIDAAIIAFAKGGYAGTSTDDIARLAEVSQPYVIRLFGSKKALFITVIEHVSGRIQEAFREAAPASGAQLADLANGFDKLLAERYLLPVLLHGFAAANADEEIGRTARGCYGNIYTLVRGLTGVTDGEARDFMSTGMLLTVLASMKVIGPDPVAQDPWMTEMIGSFEHENRYKN